MAELQDELTRGQRLCHGYSWTSILGVSWKRVKVQYLENGSRYGQSYY